MKNHVKSSRINYQKFLTQRTITFCLMILFIIPPVYCQITNNKQKMIKMGFKYGQSIRLNINEEVQFQDSLSIRLLYFSHKTPYIDGPTKATAYIKLSKNKMSEEKSLSVHGVQGTNYEEYDSLIWNAYEFQLKAFNYDESIEIIVTKRK